MERTKLPKGFYEEEIISGKSYSNVIYSGREFIGNIKVVPLPFNIKKDLPRTYHDWLYLSSISSKKPGIGSYLLEKVLDFSEQTEQPLLTITKSMGHRRLSHKSLDNWLIRKGFEKLNVKFKHCLGYLPCFYTGLHNNA